jgi:hypothetical protein
VAKLGKATGVNRSRIDRDTWLITVWYDPRLTDRVKLQAALDKATAEVDSTH